MSENQLFDERVCIVSRISKPDQQTFESHTVGKSFWCVPGIEHNLCPLSFFVGEERHEQTQQPMTAAFEISRSVMWPRNTGGMHQVIAVNKEVRSGHTARHSSGIQTTGL